MAKNSAMIAEKWARGMQGATQSMKDGIAGVTEAPGVKAAAAADKYAAGVAEAVSSGRYAANSRAVSLADWQQAMLNKGIPRVASGVTAAKPAVQRYLDIALPIAEQSKQQCAGMPSLTEEDAIAKVRVNMQNMKRIKAAYQRS